MPKEINHDLMNHHKNNTSVKAQNKVNFTLDYSSSSVSSILGSVKNCFEGNQSLDNIYYYDNNEKHYKDPLDENIDLTNKSVVCVNKIDDEKSDMANFAGDYGKILNNINSSDKLNDDDKSKLTQILDNSFDKYADNLSIALSDRISDFLNFASDNKEAIYKDFAIKVNADEISYREELNKSIRSMMSAAKIFYKNNPQGSDDELNAYISSKFSDTKDINNMSYKDVILAKNALIGGVLKDYKDDANKVDDIDESCRDLDDKGASNTLIDDFRKAYYQNNDIVMRFKKYSELDKSYTSGIKELENKIQSLKKNLEDLEKEAQDVNKAYQYNLRDLQEKKSNLNMILKMLPDGSKDKQIENLKKDNDRTLKNIAKQRVKIQGEIGELLNQIKERNKEYKEFKQDPNSAITQNLNNNQDSTKDSAEKKESNADGQLENLK